jgi:hypothetical protein
MKTLLKFGEVKNRILSKLTEAYIKEDKNEVKALLKQIKKNKNFKEMYIFYENFEKTDILKENAELYLNTIEPLFIEKTKNINKICEEYSNLLSDVKIEKNELYESLDIFSQPTTLENVEAKINAKKYLIEHLITKKEINIEKDVVIENQNLLNITLANSFNSIFNHNLEENEKKELSDILSIPLNELNEKVNTLKESLKTKIDSLLTESIDINLNNKLIETKNEINAMESNRINYFKLVDLKNNI